MTVVGATVRTTDGRVSRWLRSRWLWSALLAVAALTRGTAYLFIPATGSDALIIIRSLASMHAWGYAFCLLGIGCLLGPLSRPVAFYVHAIPGVFLNAALAVGLGYQAVVVHTAWTTVGQLIVIAVLHGLYALRIWDGPWRRHTDGAWRRAERT